MKKNILLIFIFFLSSVLFVDQVYGIGPSVPAGLSGDEQQLKPDTDHIDYFAAALYCDVRGVISGALGTLVGLLISMAGLYSYLMTRSGYGFFFFIAGVALTGLPGIFDWYYRGTAVAFAQGGAGIGKSMAATVTLEDWCDNTYNANDVSGTSAAVGNLNFKRDVRAERGEGLYSLDQTTSVGTCAHAVDNTGAVVANSGFCTK